jgi:hypothetical protein
MISIYFRQKREHGVYKQLMSMIPGLEERLFNGSEEETLHIADLVRHSLRFHRELSD